MILDTISPYMPGLDTVFRLYFLTVTCCAILSNAMCNVMVVASAVVGIFDIRQLRGALFLPVRAVTVAVVPVSEFITNDCGSVLSNISYQRIFIFFDIFTLHK